MGRTIRGVQICIRFVQSDDRSHALRGNAARDALRPKSGRGASVEAFPHGSVGTIK